MRKFLLCLLGVAWWGHPERMLASDPADQFAAAPTNRVTTGFTTDLASATAEDGEPAHCGIPARHSVWVRYQSPVAGQLRLTQTGGRYYPRVAVYEGASLATLTPVTCVSFGPFQSFLTLNVKAGTLYHVAVDDDSEPPTDCTFQAEFSTFYFAQPTGSLVFKDPASVVFEAVETARPGQVQEVTFRENGGQIPSVTRSEAPYVLDPGPLSAGRYSMRASVRYRDGTRAEAPPLSVIVLAPNDDFDRAAEIVPLSSRTTFSAQIALSTPDPGQPEELFPRTLWWRWVPRFSEAIEATAQLERYDPLLKLTVFRGDSLAGLEPLRNRFDALPGTSYYFALSGYQSSMSRQYWRLDLQTFKLIAPALAPLNPGQQSPRFPGRRGIPIALVATNLNAAESFTHVILTLGSDQTLQTWSEPPYRMEWTPETVGDFRLEATGYLANGQTRVTAPLLFRVGWENDQFAEATILPPDSREITLEMTFDQATAEPGEPSHAGAPAQHSRWWRWTPATDGLVELRLQPPGPSPAQAAVAVYRGDTLTNLTLIAQGQAFSGKTEIRFPVSAGETYRLAFDDMSWQGHTQLHVWQLRVHTLLFAQPDANAHWPLDTSGTIEVRNADPQFQPTELTLWVDGDSLGTRTEAPYRWTWTPSIGGAHELLARAADADGQTRDTQLLPVWVGPDHDDVGQARVITGAPPWRIEGDAAFASWEPFEQMAGKPGGSVWYRWTPPETHAYSLSFTGSENLNLRVYRGDPAEGGYVEYRLQGPEGRDNFPFTAGVPYYFQIIVPEAGDSGTFVLESYAPPPNDEFANALPLTGSEGTFEGLNQSAQLDPGEQYIGISGTLWWRWTAPATGDLTLEDAGSDCQVLAAIYQEKSMARDGFLTDPQPLLDFRSFNPVGIPGQLVTRVAEGITYYFALGSGSTTGPRTGVMRVHFRLDPVPDAPANDFFSQRAILSGTDLTVSGNVTWATGERQEPAQAGEKTLWWEWTAPQDGVLRLNVTANWRAILSVFQIHPETGDLRYVLPWQHQGPVAMPVRAGDTFQIAVGTPKRAKKMGAFTLYLRFEELPPAPANDDFAQRESIPATGMDQPINCLGATFEDDEPNHGEGLPPFAPYSGSRWWTFTAPFAGRLEVSPTALVVVLYQGDSLAELTRLSGSNWSPPPVELEAGQTVQLAVIGNAITEENSALRVEFMPTTPVNDAFARSIHLTGDHVTASGSLWNCTRESREPRHYLVSSSDRLTDATAWWSWAAPFSGRASVRVAGVELMTDWTLVVYEGAELRVLRRIPQSWNDTEIAFSAQKGMVYHFGVERRINGRDSVRFTLTLTPWPDAPPNDNFADATLLRGTDVANRVSLWGATREPGEPAHRAGTANQSVWWRWRAPYHCFAELANSGIVRSATLAVYTGSSLLTLRHVAGGTAYLRFPVRGGEVYYIAAETPAGEAGDVALTIRCDTPSGEVIPTPGNLLLNGSFEELENGAPGKYWSGHMDGVVNERGVDGKNYMIFAMDSEIWQDVATPVGVPCRLRFASGAGHRRGPVHLRVFANDTRIGELRFDSLAEPYPHWGEIVFTPDRETTRLRFTSEDYPATLDAVSLVALNQPPKLVRQPSSRTAFLHSPVTFEVGATGSEPLVRSWWFNGQPLPDAHGPVLHLPAVTLADAGEYRFVATNAFGSVTSVPVRLTVEVPGDPEIVWQPEGAALESGQYYVLNVVATGVPPLSYQWFKDGAPLPGATESRLVFTAFSAADAGAYRVRVSNADVGVLSLPATLRLAPPPAGEGGGRLLFANGLLEEGGPRAIPVYDADHITPLVGETFAAQLYVGATEAELRPVSVPSPFLDGYSSGLWKPQFLTLSHFPPGQPILAQVRVWDRTYGESYEEARARGGKYGHSALLTVTPVENLMAGAGELTDLESFSLTAGRPNFNTGRLELIEQRPDGVLVWQLNGAPGFRYLIERRIGNGDWQPFGVYPNPTGAITFTDQPASASGSVIYRSRILD